MSEKTDHHGNLVSKLYPGAYKCHEAAQRSVNLMVLTIVEFLQAVHRSMNLMVLTIVEFLHVHISKLGLTPLTPAANGFVT